MGCDVEGQSRDVITSEASRSHLVACLAEYRANLRSVIRKHSGHVSPASQLDCVALRRRNDRRNDPNPQTINNFKSKHEFTWDFKEARKAITTLQTLDHPHKQHTFQGQNSHKRTHVNSMQAPIRVQDINGMRRTQQQSILFLHTL